MLHVIKREFTTSLSQQRVISQIKSRLSTGYFKGDSEYFGYVSENSFKITKNLSYNLPRLVKVRNSFSPVAVGTVAENESGTSVKLKMRMAIPVFAFMLLIEIGTLIGTVLSLIQCIFGSLGDSFQPIDALLAVALLVMVELLLHFAFRLPAKNMIERLEKLLTVS